MTYRRRYVTQLNALQTPVNELNDYEGERDYQIINACTEPAIDGIKQSIKAIDQQNKQLIAEDLEWSENLNLATSVKGIGQTVALLMFVYTRNFSTEMTARKFASLIGVAPFTVESSSSVRRGTHVILFYL